jgi:hypothetical protein
VQGRHKVGSGLSFQLLLLLLLRTRTLQYIMPVCCPVANLQMDNNLCKQHIKYCSCLAFCSLLLISQAASTL